VRVSHRFTASSARFDEDNLVSDAGLVPLLGLAEQTRLPQIIAEKVSIKTPRVKSGAANPVPKLLGVIAGMCTGADSIEDLDVLRAGGMPILFDGVYAPSTLGVLLREFSFGHARQLESVLREHLVALAERTELLAGIDEQAFIDIDSLLRPVYGHAKQGASYGHTKIAGKQVLRKGLSPLATTISTAQSAPVIAGMRLRAGKTGSGKGAGRMIAQAIVTARAAGATGKILVRGDSAYGNRAVVRACLRGNAEFSLVMTKNRAIQRAIDSIPDTAWTPVRYPGAVQDPDTGAWISDAPVSGRSPRSPTPPSPPPRIGSPPGWWCAGSKTPATPTIHPHCSRCGATTRSSPTQTCPPRRPTSPTAGTRSSKPCSPTSSTDPWPTYPPGALAPTPPGRCAPRSPTTCSTPPARWPATTTPSPGARPCADG
jgi:hypothetical protein